MWLQEDLDDADAVVSGGFDMFDVIDGDAQGALVSIHQALLHFLRIESRVLPDNADHRDVYVRKNVRRRAQQDEGRDDQKQQCGHHEREWPAQCQANNPHKSMILTQFRRPANPQSIAGSWRQRRASSIEPDLPRCPIQSCMVIDTYLISVNAYYYGTSSFALFCRRGRGTQFPPRRGTVAPRTAGAQCPD